LEWKIDEIGYSNQANGWSAEEVAFYIIVEMEDLMIFH